MNLSKHFTSEALSASSTALRRGINNTPPQELMPNAQLLAAGLEAVVIVLGFALHHDSGYRCLALNIAVGGRTNSQHLRFLAEDFTCPEFGTPRKIVEALAVSSIQFDQLIEEGDWVHISFSSTPRREVLVATFDNAGKAHYTLWEKQA